MSKPTWLFSFVLVAGVLLFSLECSKNSAGDDEDADTTPPQLTADLTVIAVTSQSATLQWTAPHDYKDDNSQGMVDEYDIRVSYDSITAQNFAQAYQFDSVPGPLPAGVVHQYVVDGLESDSQYYFALKSKDNKGNWSAISNCCKGHCTPVQTVTFADSMLEKAIREHIHKPSGDIFSSDVDSITLLVAVQRGISDLSGLEYCLSVHNLFLSRNNISDITPLGSLIHLWGFDLAVNHISDVSPLANLTEATSFTLAENDISDVSALAGLTNLRRLDISANPVTDISPLASLVGLQQLFMWGAQVTDFSPLYGLEQLDDIMLSASNLTDISFMSHLTHLRIAQLGSNSISSLTPLSGLTTLEGLGLAHNAVIDVGPLAGLINLNDLDLKYNQITDIQGLVDNSGLGTGDSLRLNNNPLGQQALEVQIPALEARGVGVTH